MLRGAVMSLKLTILISCIFCASSLFAQQDNVCEGVRLSLGEKDVMFSDDCGQSPRWEYVVESDGSSYFLFELGKGFIARKHDGKFPDDNYVACQIQVTPRYPVGCTFSPNYIAFQGHAKIANKHKARISMILADRYNQKNRLYYVRGNITEDLGDFSIEGDIEGSKQTFWAPCTGRAEFGISLLAEVEDIDQSDPGKGLSFITVQNGSQVYRNTTRLGFKPCKSQ